MAAMTFLLIIIIIIMLIFIDGAGNTLRFEKILNNNLFPRQIEVLEVEDYFQLKLMALLGLVSFLLVIFIFN